MPIKHVTHVRAHCPSPELRDALVDEWLGRAEGKTDRPLIYHEGGGDRPLRVYVVWDDWQTMNQIERSEVIVDAYEKAFGTDEALNVTLAMGLTSDEARRMGIATE